jgi:monothiol glutaredoxin
MSIAEEIRKTITDNPVVLYMKGTPQFPQCGYSGRAVQMLKSCAVPFVGVNVLGNEPLRAGLVEYAQWPTLPQLWIGGEFIGGCDIMTEMFQSGDLQKQLAALSTKDA